ncbi:MAG: hypothetical protein ACPHR0_06205, partial [Candidatus Puniceispirillaceae bacterium]
MKRVEMMASKIITGKQKFDAAHYVKSRKQAEARLTEAGMYSPEMEHDACGVGFVASIDGT